MTLRKNIYTYFLSLTISLLLFPQAADAQRKKAVAEPDTVPFFRGVAVSADLVGLGMVMLSDYGQYEGAVRVNLRDRYFPIVEVGIGKADHENVVTKLKYTTSAPYAKIGIDFNLMKNKHDIYRLYGGVRYAYTSFKYDVEHPGVEVPYWGDVAEFGGKDIKANYHWVEAVFGVDAKIWGPIHLGWSARYKRRISHDNGTLGKPWYVPGFGKSGGSRLGGTFNVTLEF